VSKDQKHDATGREKKGRSGTQDVKMSPKKKQRTNPFRPRWGKKKPTNKGFRRAAGGPIGVKNRPVSDEKKSQNRRDVQLKK